jgi:D-sedoheptulose 7-phosphate isomerase
MSKNKLLEEIRDSIELKKTLLTIEIQINKTITKIFSTLKNGGKVFICGNGGSAADAQHLSAEF